MLLFLATLIAIFVVWYIICDKVASKCTNYVFPAHCSRCDSLPTWKNWEVRREWFLEGHDILNQVFPSTVREAQIPLCEKCFSQAEAHKKQTNKISLLVAALAFPPSSYLSYQLIHRPGFCLDASLGVILCNISLVFICAILGVASAAIMYFICLEVAGFFPNLAPPATFTIMGKLRFYNPSYQTRYLQLNPNPEIHLAQRNMPFGPFIGAMILLILSAGFDLDPILNGHRWDPPIRTYPIQYVLIASKLIAAVLIYRLKISGIILMSSIAFTEIFFNPNFNFDDEAEEFIIGGALLIIIAYEWMQTRKEA